MLGLPWAAWSASVTGGGHGRILRVDPRAALRSFCPGRPNRDERQRVRSLSGTVAQMSTVRQVPLLSRSQIARFKRDGYLILEGVLDPGMCGRVRTRKVPVVLSLLVQSSDTREFLAGAATGRDVGHHRRAYAAHAVR